MEKLLILDSNSILNRAFYGIRYLSNADGTPTNAVYGFLNILLKLINEQNPDYVCAAFDVHAPTFRHKMYDDYKAQRKPAPEGLTAQFPIARDVLRAMGIPVIEKPGYEADDIIGTVSKLCDDKGIECYIATGDKDDLQLASDKTKVILTVTKSGYNETIVYDSAAVKERYHVTPEEFIDVKALMGDASDNIPGVAGIGEKTAMSLIEKYHSIEYIYNNLEETDIKGAALKKLTEGRESAFLSKELATIIRDVPLENFSIDECRYSGAEENGELYSLLKKLELNSIIKKLELTPLNTEAPSADIYSDTSVTAVTDSEELVKILKCVDELAFLPEYDEGGIRSAAFAVGKAAYYTKDITQSDLNNAFLPVLTEGRAVVCDIKDFIVKFAVISDINALKFDIAIAAYLINPSKSQYTLDGLASEFLGVELDKNEETQMSLLDDEDTAEGGETAAKRALAILPLRDVLSKELEKNGQTALYYDIELPLVCVLAHMQINGFLVDEEALEDFSVMLSAHIDALTKEIYFLADEEFNINSPKQLGVILFEKMQLKPVKKTKSGYSTNAEALEKLKDKSPIINMVLEYRQYAKLKSTYCDGLRSVINPKTKRIHSNFTQTVTVTGRISSTEPNLQNIPTRTELGREIRKMFVAKEGYTLVDADYSQIELRVLSDIADDKTMQSAFINGEDIHTVTASQVLGIPADKVTSEQRRAAKAVNFGIVYGISEFSLANDLGIGFGEAKAYIDSYLAKYHGVREYMEKIKEQAKKDGYVKTVMNRIRYIPELKSPNPNLRKFGERVALNTPIQGTAADIIKLAMVRVDNRLIREGLKSRLILQVHDELIIEAHNDEIQEVRKILDEEMRGAMSLKVPLTADMSEGRSWYDAK